MSSQNLSSPRKYIEVVIAQSAKRTGNICGDYVIVDRTRRLPQSLSLME